MIKGYRNTIISMAYLANCAYMTYIAGPEHVVDLGAAFGGLGLGTAAAIGMRAANKWAENGSGEKHGA